MNATFKILFFLTDVILPLYIGYYLQKYTKVKQTSFDRMMFFNIYILSTFLNILSFWTIKLNSELIWIPLLGVLMHIIPGTIAYFTMKSKYDNPLEQGSYILSALLSNRGVIGAISVFILFNEKGYALSQLVMLPSNFILYLFCFPLAQYFYQVSRNCRGRQISLKGVFFTQKQIPTLGILAGVTLNILNYHCFQTFTHIFNYSVHIRSWLYMLPLGYSISFIEIKNYWNNVWNFAVIKFIATPFIVYILGRLIISDPITLSTLVILSGSPTAINAVVTAKIYKLNINLAMAAFVSTTAIYSLIIYPVIFLMFTH